MSAYSRRKRAGKQPKRAKPERRTPPAVDRRVQVTSASTRRTPRTLPWEGDDADDYYDRDIDRLMREVPGR